MIGEISAFLADLMCTNVCSVCPSATTLDCNRTSTALAKKQCGVDRFGKNKAITKLLPGHCSGGNVL